MTTDLFLETTHFRRDWHSPQAAGHRCLARGLSDLAAMGARPLAAFLSFAIPPELAGSWSTRFLDGLLALARLAKVPLAGGDTAEAPSPGRLGTGGHALFAADITLLGSVPAGTALLRTGARAGDLLYVTGALGGAAAELTALSEKPASFRRWRMAASGHPHLFPEPRLAQGLRLRALASAAIDLSDGISTDLAHLCAASGVRAEVELARLPVHPFAVKAADSAEQAWEQALHGGEDYELLFTASPRMRVPRSIVGVPIRQIGRMFRAGRDCPMVTLVEQDGERHELASKGWQHFKSKPQA